MYNWSTLKKLIWLFAAKLNGGDVTKTVSGSPAHITDALAKDALSVLASIEPIQDLHGYSNPWPAGGGVSKCPSFANGTHTTTNGLTVTIQNGEITINGTASGSGYYEEAIESTVMPADAYVSFNNPVGTFNIAYVFINGQTQIASPSLSPANGTKQPTGLSGATVNRLRIFCNAGTYDNFKMSPIVHDGSTPQAWQPYANICPISGRSGLNVYVSPTEDIADATAYAEDWTLQAGTVYGGTVDVVSGGLTVWYGITTFGKLNPNDTTSPNVFRFFISGKQSGRDNFLCSAFKVVNKETPANYEITGMENSSNVYVKDTDYSTAADFKTAFSDQQIIYELATPVTYNLTPQEVQMLLSENYVWSSSGDTVSVTYYAEGNANPLQSLNILLDGNYSNPKTADDVSDKEALEIILGGNK